MAQATGTHASTRVLPRGLMAAVRQIIPTLSYPAATPAEVQLQGGIPLDLPLLGLLLTLKYRANVTGAATAVNADAPLSLIQYIRIQGQHKRLGNVTNYGNVSLADIAARLALKKGVRAANYGASLAVGVGTYDVWAEVFIPLSLPELANKHDVALSLLNGPDWNSLNFFASFGGFADLYTGGAGTILGYGGVGSPQISLSRVTASLGAGSNLRPFIPTWTQTVAPNSALATAVTAGQIYPNLTIGQMAYADILLKTFTQAAGSPAAATLLDGTALTRVLFQIDTTPVVIAPWHDLQYATENSILAGAQAAQAHYPGYALQDWAQGDQESAFQTQLFSAASRQFGLYGDVTVVANALLSFLSTVILPAA